MNTLNKCLSLAADEISGKMSICDARARCNLPSLARVRIMHLSIKQHETHSQCGSAETTSIEVLGHCMSLKRQSRNTSTCSKPRKLCRYQARMRALLTQSESSIWLSKAKRDQRSAQRRGAVMFGAIYMIQHDDQSECKKRTRWSHISDRQASAYRRRFMNLSASKLNRIALSE